MGSTIQNQNNGNRSVMTVPMKETHLVVTSHLDTIVSKNHPNDHNSTNNLLLQFTEIIEGWFVLNGYSGESFLRYLRLFIPVEYE